jgi:hypothetical protein
MISFFIPNSAVESKMMSEEQTFRTEDNTFLLLSRGTVASAARNYIEPMKRHAKRQKDFEAARLGVFATPGLPLTHFNCETRVHWDTAGFNCSDQRNPPLSL